MDQMSSFSNLDLYNEIKCVPRIKEYISAGQILYKKQIIIDVNGLKCSYLMMSFIGEES